MVFTRIRKFWKCLRTTILLVLCVYLLWVDAGLKNIFTGLVPNNEVIPSANHMDTINSSTEREGILG